MTRTLIRHHAIAAPARREAAGLACLCFQLGDDVCAVPRDQVREVVTHGELIVAPGLPPLLRGAIKLRHSLVPVLDLHPLLGGRPLQPGIASRVVVVAARRRDESVLAGLLVDAVGDSLDLAPGRIEPLAAGRPGADAAVVRGRACMDWGELILLDPARVIAPEVLAWLEGETDSLSDAASGKGAAASARRLH